MGVLFGIVLTLFLIVCVFLCLIVLIQESKSLGLGASFGGDAGESVFGTATADILKKITMYLGIAFLVGCILLSNWSEIASSTSKDPLPVTIEKQA